MKLKGLLYCFTIVILIAMAACSPKTKVENAILTLEKGLDQSKPYFDSVSVNTCRYNINYHRFMSACRNDSFYKDRLEKSNRGSRIQIITLSESIKNSTQMLEYSVGCLGDSVRISIFMSKISKIFEDKLSDLDDTATINLILSFAAKHYPMESSSSWKSNRVIDQKIIYLSLKREGLMTTLYSEKGFIKFKENAKHDIDSITGLDEKYITRSLIQRPEKLTTIHDFAIAASDREFLEQVITDLKSSQPKEN